jgi:hypothetical protein
MAASVTFSQRLVESIYAYGADSFQANAYDRMRVIDALMNRGKGFKDTSQAGSFVLIPVNVKKLGISQMTSEGSEYNLINTEGDQGAQYKWVTAVTPVIFTDEELGENQGKQQIINTVTNKLDEAKLDHTNLLNTQLLTGTGTAPSSESLSTIVGTATNGGLDPASYPLWVGAVTSGGNLSATVLDAAIDSTMFASDQGIDFLFSNLTLFQRQKDLSATKTTVFQPADVNDPNKSYSGVEIIQFRGAVWTFDRLVPAQTLYGIDSRNIRMFVQPGRDMDIFPEKISPTSLAKHLPIVSRFQFAPLARRAHFKITSLGVS